MRGRPAGSAGAVVRLAMLSAAIALGGCAQPPGGPASARTVVAPAAATPTPTTAPTTALTPTTAALPEVASAFVPRPARDFARHAVAAAHPLAAEAGVQVLREGGNALDAAIAAAFVLGVVEPAASGIGGGALLLHWDGHALAAWDGRETAPAAAGPGLFLQPDGRPWPFAEARASGLAVGVSGAVAAYAAAHRAGGRLPWARLLAPAVRHAREGFVVGPRLARQLAELPALADDPVARALYFRADGTPRRAGDRIANPALAAVLERIAAEGDAVLRRGSVAEGLLRRARAEPRPGALAPSDLAGYRALRREPLCADTGRHRVCGFPPPSSGGLAVAQLLGLLDATGARWQLDADSLHTWIEAHRLVFADRARYVADPDAVAAPAGDWRSLLAPAYLRQRAALIGPRRAGAVEAGSPGGAAVAWGVMPAGPQGGTTHVSVVDGEGQAVALTASIEAAFGALRVSDDGIVLNNQLTDFALAPADARGRVLANAPGPGKRPRSSMSPTIVFERQGPGGGGGAGTGAGPGRPVLVLGSALGPFIIPAVARVVSATLDSGADLADALAAPLVADLGTGTVLVEAGRLDAATLAALRARGHPVRELPLASGLHAIQRLPSGGWRAAADPRREGGVRGD